MFANIEVKPNAVFHKLNQANDLFFSPYQVKPSIVFYKLYHSTGFMFTSIEVKPNTVFHKLKLMIYFSPYQVKPNIIFCKLYHSTGLAFQHIKEMKYISMLQDPHFKSLACIVTIAIFKLTPHSPMITIRIILFTLSVMQSVMNINKIIH